MGRSATEALLASDVARKYNVAVWSPSEIRGIPAGDLQHLLGAGYQEWSGFTLRYNDRHLIVANSAQSARRQNSVVMHELAHIILGHELVSGVVTASEYFIPRTYGQDQEDEAAWLGGTLLLPRSALLWMRSRRMPEHEAASYFLVSPELLKWRIRMSGIDYQLGISRRAG